jgi:hypothetical protein
MENKILKIKWGLFALCFIFLLESVFALPIYVKPIDGSGNLQPSTSFDYVFNFTTSGDCSGVVLSNSSTIVTGKDGIGFIDIDVSGISSIPSYLCEYIDGDLRATHTLSDQLFKDIYAEDIALKGNLTLGQKITFTLGEIIDNLVNDWVRITGGLNVSDSIIAGGNVTAEYFIGNGSQLTGINAGDLADDGTFLLATGDTATGNYTFDTNTLHIDSTNNRVGIGTTAPGSKLSIDAAKRQHIFFKSSSETGRDKIAGFFSDTDMRWEIGPNNKAMGDTGPKIVITGEDYSTFEGYSSDSITFNTGDAISVKIQSDGNVGIGTASPATSAKLDITSTTGALLVSRMTTTQRDDLTAVNGMIIYNSTTNAFNFYENGAWVTGSGLA